VKTQQQHNILKAKDKRKMDLIEAALYAAGRPLDVDTLSSLINEKSKETVKSLAEILITRYKEVNGGLELLRLHDGRYVMQLRPDLVQGVMKLVTKKLLTRGPLKTLSFIAIKQPVTQAYVVKVRGNLAYVHIKILRERGLISEEKLGRTKILKTTPVFSDYFSLSSDSRTMKQQLQKMFEQQKSKDKKLSVKPSDLKPIIKS
jgi:segregation and condensation protein B